MTASADSPAARPRRIEALAVAAAAVIVAYQLFVPPIVGLADNGDFDRVLVPVGLSYETGDYSLRYFHFLTQRWNAVPPRWPREHVASEQLFAGLARLATLGTAPRGVFDVRALGAVHTAAFLAALGLLLAGSRGWPTPARAVFAAALLFFFTDVGYAALFQSFFTATASYLALLLLAGTVVCLARGMRSPALSGTFWVAAALFLASKPQETALAPLLGLSAVLLARTGRGPAGVRGAIAGAAALCGLAAALYVGTARDLRKAAVYDAVFDELLPRSPSPVADLSELGLPPDWVRLSGTSAFQTGAPMRDPAFRTELFGHVTHARIARFYLEHPSRLAVLAREGSKRAFLLRPRLGNFTRESGAAPDARSQAFAVWSRAKAALGPSGPWLLPIFWIANFAGALAAWGSSRDPGRRALAIAMAMLAALAAAEFFVCLLAEGVRSLNRHLHSFNAMTDLALAADLACLAWLLSRAEARRRAATAG